MKERLGAWEEISEPVPPKLEVLNKNMLTMRANQPGLEHCLEKLEPSNVS